MSRVDLVAAANSCAAPQPALGPEGQEREDAEHSCKHQAQCTVSSAVSSTGCRPKLEEVGHDSVLPVVRAPPQQLSSSPTPPRTPPTMAPMLVEDDSAAAGDGAGAAASVQGTSSLFTHCPSSGLQTGSSRVYGTAPHSPGLPATSLHKRDKRHQLSRGAATRSHVQHCPACAQVLERWQRICRVPSYWDRACRGAQHFASSQQGQAGTRDLVAPPIAL